MNNLSDPRQVAEAKEMARVTREKELNDIRTVLSNASGRRLIWRLLERFGTFRSIFHSDPSTMSYLSGQQDLGHFLMSEIADADERLLIRLMKDNKKGETHDTIQ